MMKLKKSLYLVLCLLIGVPTLSSCIEEYEADISAEDSNLLVVEGTICSAQLNKFYLSRTQALNTSYAPQMVTGAIVSIRGNDGTEYTMQDYGDYYACQVGTLAPDVKYYLHIETDGEVYESEPQKPLRTESIADIRGVQNTPTSNIDVLITPNDPFQHDQANYYSWTYDETWEVRPECKTIWFYDINQMAPVQKLNQFPERGWRDASGTTIMVGASTNYDGQHIRELKLYDIDRDDPRIFYKYSGLVHQRAITKAEYEYELARRQAGSEMGGLFTPLPSALPTNIHCLTSRKHVIGYIGCSFNTSDYRFFLNGGEFAARQSTLGDNRIWIDEPTEEDCLRMVQKGLYLCEWDTPERSIDGKLHAAWAFRHQLDVRYKYPDVYIKAPYYWPYD